MTLLLLFQYMMVRPWILSYIRLIAHLWKGMIYISNGFTKKSDK